MTKKHFIKIAEYFGSFKHYLINDNSDIQEELQGLIDNIKLECMKSNSQFDSARFDNAIQKQFEYKTKNPIQ